MQYDFGDHQSRAFGLHGVSRQIRRPLVRALHTAPSQTGAWQPLFDCRWAPVHRSVIAKEFVLANESRLRLIRSPGYCPELNPDELLSQDVTTNGLGKSRPSNRPEKMASVRTHLRRRQRQPQVIKISFKKNMLNMLLDELRTIYRPAQ